MAKEQEFYVMNNINTLNDSMKEVSKVATNASNAFKALTEVLMVDPAELKKALLLGALRDAAEGKEVTYEGNVWKDLLELVEGLEKENKELTERRYSNRNEIKDLRNVICKAKKELEWPIESNMFFGRGWVSKHEANEALEYTSNKYRKIIIDTYSALDI